MKSLESLQKAIEELPATKADTALRQVLAPLINYDEVHGSDLVFTLTVYLKNEGHVAGSAEVLFLHRNSVLYRLQRIQELSGLDIRDSQVRRLLSAALTLTEPEFLRDSEVVKGKARL